MTVEAIPRTMWQDPTKPIAGPPRKQPFRQGVVHWEGAVDRSVTPADIPRHLRNMQAAYLSSRGYSLGYGFAVVSDVLHPADGTRWEIRGTDINMASNPGRKLNQGNANDWTGSVLIIGPDTVGVTPKAAQSVRNIFSQWHADAGTTPLRPVPHSDLDYTTCCGPHYVANINAGRFDPTAPAQPEPTPTPPATPTEGDPNMLISLIRLKGTAAVYAQYSGGYKVWIRDGNVYNVYAWVTSKKVVDIDNRALFEASGPIMGDRPNGVDTYGLPV